MKIEVFIETERDRIRYNWSVSGYFSTYIPAKLEGPAEDCYPEEGGELEDIVLTLASIGYGTALREPLYYHLCYPQEPTYNEIEVALFEQYDKEKKRI